MNKKGFTLVELIAVIVILALLALIANSSVTNVIKNSKSDLYNTQIQLIKSAAETWGGDNFDKLPEDGNCSYITLGVLKGYGLFEDEVINPKTNKEFSDDMYIKITSKVNSNGVLITKYDVDVDNVSNCEDVYKPICRAVTEENKTTGNIPSGNYTLGDEYICSVNNTTEYHFFILSVEENNVNLIMDSNININGESVKTGDQTVQNTVAWYEGDTIEYGPITALNYLQVATNSWTNLDKIIINEFDIDGSSRKYYLSQKYNLYARLPGLNEMLATGCIEFTENSCPTWANGYYWTNSLSGWLGIGGTIAWFVGIDYQNITTLAGIRPVISVHKAYLN